MTTHSKVTGYLIVEAHLSTDLVSKVQAKVAEGWEPFGPVTFGTFRREEATVEVWAQTLVKYTN
jgi:hypothetical protein